MYRFLTRISCKYQNVRFVFILTINFFSFSMNLSSKNNLKMSPKETDSRTEVKMHSRKKEILHREFDSTKCANIIILDS